MAKLSTDLRTAVLHPRESLSAMGVLGANNAEVIADCDGCGSVTLDLRGTYNFTLEVSGTVDGTNWTLIPIRSINTASVIYLASITGAGTGGIWQGSCSGFRRVRARVTAYTSGSATATIMANLQLLDQSLQGLVTTSITTLTAAAGAACNFSIGSPGAGLRNYLTYLAVTRFAAAALVAAATPVLVTTGNIPGTLVFTFPADAAAQGTTFTLREDFAYPIASSAQATATTITGPATTNVIWRITAGYYVAP